MVIRSYVALGDSFTEGLDDPYPERLPHGGSGPAAASETADPPGPVYRGWADLVAAQLAAQAADGGPAEPFRYANLAIRGRLLDAVVSEQVPVAVGMRPDLYTLAAGGNDALRRGFDLTQLLDRFDAVVRQLRSTGAQVVLFRFVDMSRRLPGKRVLRPRVAAMNDAVLEVARRNGARVADLWSDRAFDHPALWSSDRLHLSATGHQRVAARVLQALDLEPDPTWLLDPGPVEVSSWPRARVADVRWVWGHLRPWIGRRLAGRSSGDARDPKRPRLTPYADYSSSSGRLIR